MASSFAPRFGGVETVVQEVAERLVARGHTLEICTPIAADPAQPFSSSYAVRRIEMPLPPARPLRGPFELIRGVRALIRLVGVTRRLQPDIVHVHCFSGNGVYGLVLSWLFGLPLVVTLHGETVMDDDDIYAKSFILRRALRWALRRAAVVTACSRYALDDALHRFGPASGVQQVVYNGVDAEELATPEHAPHRFVMGAGRLVKKKGFELLLEAIASLPQEFADVDVVLVGDGPQYAELRELGDRLGLGDRLRLYGRRSLAQTRSLMAAAEVVVVPSLLEPFGLVVLEAWSAGTPVIATTAGGIPEYASNAVDAVLVDPDPAQLRIALLRVLDDSDLRARLAVGGSRTVAAFTWDAAVDQYERLYRQCEVRHSSRRIRNHSGKLNTQ